MSSDSVEYTRFSTGFMVWSLGLKFCIYPLSPPLVRCRGRLRFTPEIQNINHLLNPQPGLCCIVTPESDRKDLTARGGSIHQSS